MRQRGSLYIGSAQLVAGVIAGFGIGIIASLLGWQVASY
jgi:hypothetical protein